MAKLSIYGCGGTGINVMRRLYDEVEKLSDQFEVPFGEINYFAVSTSKTDLRPTDETDIECWLCAGEDGAGGDRSSAARIFGNKDYVDGILKAFVPEDINLVIHSTTGGTGPIAATTIAMELIRRGKIPIMVSIGSEGSQIEVTNSLKTLRSLDKIGVALDTAIPIIYGYTENLKTRDSVDKDIHEAVMRLICTLSGDHGELDSADILNALNPIRILPDNHTGLYRMDCLTYKDGAYSQDGGQWERDTPDYLGVVDTTISIRKDNDDDPKLPVGQAFDPEGFFSSDEWGATSLNASTVFALSRLLAEEIINHAEEGKARFEEFAKLRRTKRKVDDSDNLLCL